MINNLSAKTPEALSPESKPVKAATGNNPIVKRTVGLCSYCIMNNKKKKKKKKNNSLNLHDVPYHSQPLRHDEEEHEARFRFFKRNNHITSENKLWSRCIS